MVPAQDSPRQGTNNLDSQMQAAVESFRSKMYTANRKFLNDGIDEINTFNLPEPKKLNIMAHFWYKSTEWPRPGRPQATAPANIHEHRALENQVSNLEQIRSLAHYHMDGVEGPSLRSAGRRRMYLEEMERVCNERFRPDGVIKVSPELESFIKLTGGVVDLDFRYDGICGFSLFHGGQLAS